ncbi:MAG: hypothetical protein AAF311_16390 [Pseudomonadota bacterium]
MPMTEVVKMRLPGESPWGIVRQRTLDGRAVIEINNRVDGDCTDAERAELAKAWFGEDAAPLPRMHNHRFGDLLLCEMSKDGRWKPVDDEHSGFGGS